MTPGRRTVLAGIGASLLAACTSRPRRSRPEPVPVDPDVALRAGAVAREQALIAALDRSLTILTGTPAGTTLAQLRADHAVHLQALVQASATTSPTSTAPPAAAPTSSRPASPATQMTYRRAQAAREKAAATAHAAAARSASGPLAALLAQLAASESAHAVVL